MRLYEKEEFSGDCQGCLLFPDAFVYLKERSGMD